MARRLPTRAALITAVVGVGALAVSMSPGATASGSFTQKWSIANAGPFGGEPSLASDPKGVLYDMTPSGGMFTYRSTDHGTSWKQTATADPSSGDDCVTPTSPARSTHATSPAATTALRCRPTSGSPPTAASHGVRRPTPSRRNAS